MTALLDRLIAQEKVQMAEVPAAPKAEVWNALQQSLAAGVPAPVEVPLPPATGLPGWILALIGGASALSLGLWLTRSPPPAPEPAPPPVEQVVPVADPPQRVVPPAPPPPKKLTRRPKRKPRAAPSLAEQLRALAGAQAALKEGRFSAAVDEVRKHEQRFPKSVLAQERSAIDAIARCSGGLPRAKESAATFLERWPRSPQADRVRRACRTIDRP